MYYAPQYHTQWKQSSHLCSSQNLNLVHHGSWKDFSDILKEYLLQGVKPEYTSLAPFFLSREKQKGKNTLHVFTRNMVFGTVWFAARQHPINIFFPLHLIQYLFQSTKVQIAKNLTE